MTKPAISPAIVPKTYAELRDAVLAVVVEGRRAIDRAWVGSYHEIGRLIHEHLLFKKARAAYGAGVFAQLSEESGISSRTLHECVLFCRRIPIVRRGAQFNWAKYRVFCQVEGDAQRLALMTTAAKEGWATDRIIEQVRGLNAAIDIEVNPGSPASTKPAHKPLVPPRGTPGLHLIVDRDSRLAVDLGFKLYWPLSADESKRFAKGDIVRIAGDDSLRRVEEATKADLFTYAATLRRVVDGDTLVVALEVAPGIFMEQKLRLRGLDCPELSTPGGKAAKQFVDGLVARASGVIIHTTKPDKYDRYLADVFLVGATDQSSKLSAVASAKAEASAKADALFLNNALLENGHAVRKDAWEFGDWGFGG